MISKIERKYILHISQKQTLLLFLITFFFMISITIGTDVMYAITLFVWFLSFFYAVSNLQERSLYFIFLIAFFVFLLGGHFCYEYFGMPVNYYIGDDYYFHSNLCLFLSLTAILLGNIVTGRFELKKRLKNHYSFKDKIVATQKKSSNVSVRKWSKSLFYITFPFWIYTIMDRISFVLSNDYFSSYVEYESSAPYVIRAIAAMTPYFLYLFFATIPSKRECKMPICLYLIYAIVSLLTGKRANFTVMILFVVLYFIYRHYRNDNEIWIKKSYIIIAIIAIPVGSVLLQTVQYIRASESAVGMSVKDLFLGFFSQQGFSSSIIRLEKYYEDSLREDTFYSFFGLVKFFRTNTILSTIFDPQYDFSYVGNSVEYAVRGNSLANALSYLALGKTRYLMGVGTGTCYIAELYHDFGYIGVFVGSSLYGIVMKVINRIWNSRNKFNVWTIAIGFAMVESFIKAPRWNYDIIISYFLDLGMWMAFILVFILSKIMKRG